VAEAAKKYGKRIAVIPAGERWPGGTLRPAFEDLVGAGAIIRYLGGHCSPEAYAAKSAFLAAESELKKLLLRCGSGKELMERGYEEDVLIAAELNVSECVPTFKEDAYIAL
jgi:2-phosphosulfolactate phosphatase